MSKAEQVDEQEIEASLQRERTMTPSQFVIEQAFPPYDDQGNYLERE